MAIPTCFAVHGGEIQKLIHWNFCLSFLKGLLERNDKCEKMTVAGKYWMCQKQENCDKKWNVNVIQLGPRNNRHIKNYFSTCGQVTLGVLY